jgi:hypothetical protein
VVDFSLHRRTLRCGSLVAAALLFAGSTLAQDGQSRNASPSLTGPFVNIWSAGNSISQSNQFGLSLAELPTGTLVAVGGDAFLKNSCRTIGGMWLNAVNPSGGSKVFQQLWGNCSPDAQWGIYVRGTSDGGFIVSGEDDSGAFGICRPCALLMKFTGADQLAWQEELVSFAGGAFLHPRQTSDGGFILVGNGDDGIINHGVLLKIASNGAGIWGQTYTESATSFPNAIVNLSAGLVFNSAAPTQDGGYIATGVADAKFASGFANVLVVVKTDSLGNPVWAQAYFGNIWGSWVQADDQQYPIFPLSDGTYLLSGTAQQLDIPFQRVFLFMHIDNNGNVLSASGYGGTGSNGQNKTTAHSAIQTSNGGFVMAGDSDIFVSGETHGLAVWTDNQGTIVRQNYYSGTEPSGQNAVQLTDVIQTSDGGYAFAGSAYVGSPSFGGPGFLLGKTDANGEIGTCNCVHTATASILSLDLVAHGATFTVQGFTPALVNSSIAKVNTSVSPTTLH